MTGGDAGPLLSCGMGAYVAVFFAAMAVDCVPVFAPPAWTLILLGVMHWKLELWPACAAGAAGSTLGRYVVGRYLPRLMKRWFTADKNENIAFLGRKLDGRFTAVFAFVLLYSLTPLSTTALFTAAGAAKASFRPILPAFFLGKTVGDAVCVMAGRQTIRSAGDLLKGQLSPRGLATAVLALAVLGALLVVDWRQLLQRRRLRFDWRLLKRG